MAKDHNSNHIYERKEKKNIIRACVSNLLYKQFYSVVNYIFGGFNVITFTLFTKIGKNLNVDWHLRTNLYKNMEDFVVIQY